MIVAMRDGRRVLAQATGERAQCPDCREQLIAKVGALVAPHWAHASATPGCGGGGPEGEFHRRWKMLIGGCDPDRIEVRVGSHRADAIDAGGYVVEVQCSAISDADIKSREATYGERLIWLAPDTRLSGRVRAPLIIVDEVYGRARCRDRMMDIADLEAAIPAFGVSFLTMSPVLGLVRWIARFTTPTPGPPPTAARADSKPWTTGVVELLDACDVGAQVLPAGTRLWGYRGGVVWQGGHIACRVHPVTAD